jgi:hypothetical protein
MLDGEGRIVDSLYFGTFGKASSVWPETNKQSYYVYCPGPKAVLKLNENEENLADLPQGILDEKLVAISLNSLADASGMSVEAVTALLTGLRDEIVDIVVVKKQSVSLNFNFGLLQLRAGGVVEFKTNSVGLAAEGDCDKMASTMSPDMAEKMLSSAEKKSMNGTFNGKRQSESASR